MFSDCSTLLSIKFREKKEEISFNDEKRLYVSLPETINDENFQNMNKNIENDCFEWNTKISVINEIFSNCSSLISLPDISKWDTHNIMDMSKIFYNCKSLSFIPDISKWDTGNVIDMEKMFYNCSSLSLLPDLSKWKINKIVNMDKIFYNCLMLSSLPDISKWNTINNLELAIQDCISLKDLPLKSS